MNDLLTLAISQTYANDKYEVLTYCLEDERFYPLEIYKENFFSNDGSAVWDIFHVTRVGGVQSEKLKLCKAIGSTQMVGKKTKKEMKEFFAKKVSKAGYVFSKAADSDGQSYYVIKADTINEIQKPQLKDKKWQSIIEFGANGTSFAHKLNKDYRWLAYWEKIAEEDIPKKIDDWITYFGKCDKEIYLVIKKYQFPKNGNIGKWISGFHCI